MKTAEEYKGDVVNILVCGIDYEEDVYKRQELNYY